MQMSNFSSFIIIIIIFYSLFFSHFSLLLGCALPIWMSSGYNDRPLAPFAGILSLGIGDTMVSELISMFLIGNNLVYNFFFFLLHVSSQFASL